jgi:hypothetical protein
VPGSDSSFRDSANQRIKKAGHQRTGGPPLASPAAIHTGECRSNRLDGQATAVRETGPGDER